MPIASCQKPEMQKPAYDKDWPGGSDEGHEKDGIAFWSPRVGLDGRVSGSVRTFCRLLARACKGWRFRV